MIDARTRHRPDPAYLRELLERAGVSQREAARALGIGDRQMRAYLRLPTPEIVCPYPVQVCLEILSGRGQAARRDLAAATSANVPPPASSSAA